MQTLQQVVLVAVGGAAGAVSRYGLTALVQRWLGRGYPWGTLLVNMLGCLGIGLVAGYVTRRLGAGHWAHVLLLVGFLGAFTTFSTFAHDTRLLLVDQRWLAAAGNVLLQNILGVALAMVGFAVAMRW